MDNLTDIIQTGELLSDSLMRQRQAKHTSIGYEHIKDRRLNLPVSCRQGTTVGQYVPFYFCSRSAMLYVIERGNTGQLAYEGGQGAVVHLVAYLNEVISWSQQMGVKWCFSNGNAGSPLTDFFCNPSQLSEINWDAVTELYWSQCREEKQAEFLVHNRFPWSLFHEIGTMTDDMKTRVEQIMVNADHRPVVNQRRRWYY